MPDAAKSLLIGSAFGLIATPVAILASEILRGLWKSLVTRGARSIPLDERGAAESRLTVEPSSDPEVRAVQSLIWQSAYANGSADGALAETCPMGTYMEPARVDPYVASVARGSAA